MEILNNGYTLRICEGGFPLSTDSMVLAHFAALGKNCTVLDLGSGCGTLGLLLCAKDPLCHVTGVELDENAHNAALQNIDRNGLSHRMESIHDDLRKIRELVGAGSFQVCVSNPPYFQGGPAAALKEARREDCCSSADLFAAAAWALKFGGDLFLVHRPERLAQLCAEACAQGLEPKRLGLLRHKEGGPVALILLHCRKGAKPGLIWEELCLHHADGSPTDFYRRVYHL